MKYSVEIEVEYTPLPAENEAAWEEALSILVGWLKEVDEED